MKPLFVALAALLTALILPMTSLSADPFRVGDLAVEQPWARASIGKRPGAAYFTVRNTGDTPDRLIAVSSPQAGTAEIHSMTQQNGVMRMSAAGAVDVTPQEALVLKPGGLHVMLMKLKSPLIKGEKIALKLTFEKAGALTIEAPVLGAGSMGPAE